jgi:hypothetical protein
MAKFFQYFSIAGGLGCFVIGWVASLSGGTSEDVIALGHTLVIAGALLISAVLISSAIRDDKNRK